jgi:DNA-directed RNA polymerase specialized sigma24 family protein
MSSGDYREPALQVDANLSGWPYRTATNLGIDTLRASFRRRQYEETAGRQFVPCPSLRIIVEQLGLESLPRGDECMGNPANVSTTSISKGANSTAATH